MATVQKEVSDRSAFGKVMKWLFIGFNVLMLIWMFSAMSAIGSIDAPANSAEQAGQAIGAGLGFTFLLFIWGLGDIILGMFELFTRRKKLITVEE
ncbi:MAG: hypothetical protein AB7U63_13380 [Porticoccaceae bacterium]